MCTGKEIISSSKLIQMDTDVVTHTFKFLFGKNLNTEISTMFFCKFLQNEGLSQNMGLFQLEIGLAYGRLIQLHGA